jgi:hypothetical protein
MNTSTESPERLEKMARHLQYEMEVFLYAAQLVPSWMAESDNRKGKLVFEAFLTHFRNLLQFFYGKNDKKSQDQARAYHYGWIAKRPKWYQAYSDRCDQLLAHLSYDRIKYIDEGTVQWIFDVQIDQLRVEWNNFIQALSPERQAWFGYSSMLSEYKTECFVAGTTMVTVHRPAIYRRP